MVAAGLLLQRRTRGPALDRRPPVQRPLHATPAVRRALAALFPAHQDNYFGITCALHSAVSVEPS